MTTIFRPQVQYGTDVQPADLVAADVNKDGRLDLITVNFGSNDISVLLGNGDGSFKTQKTYPIGGSGPEALAVGDFNLDGKLDIATANFNSNSVQLLAGDGSGGFSNVMALGGPIAGPLDIAVADFNKDGRLDYVTANQNSGNVVVFFGDGNFGTLGLLSGSIGGTPSAVAVGDLNGDGNSDIVVTDAGHNRVITLLGNGTGGFSSGGNFSTGAAPVSVALADLNGDGRLDVIAGNRNDPLVSVLLGNGNGTLQAAINATTASMVYRVAVGDVDGDGKQDIVASLVNETVQILKGDGLGHFTALSTMLAGADPLGLVINDFNLTGDKRLDLAVANVNSNSVSVLLQDEPPVAVAGGPYTVLVGNGTTLNAGKSFDPDAAAGDFIVRYDWDLNNDGVFEAGAGLVPTLTLTAAQVQASFGFGLNTLGLRVTDSFGATSTATTTLFLDRPPVANDDSVSATQDALTILGSTLTTNDSDPDGDTLSITAVGNAQHGSVQLNGGNVIFTPELGYAGAAGFTYTLSDAHGATAAANVRVNVTPFVLSPDQITLVSASPGGQPGNNFSYTFNAGGHAVSYDGRYVAFTSGASNLVSGDGNGSADVFVKDLQTGSVRLVSTTQTGEQGNFDSVYPTISADGRYVAFMSTATNFAVGDGNGTWDIFLKDLQTGALSLISTSTAKLTGNNFSGYPSISADGRYVAFYSQASNLVSGDNNFTSDFFVKDLQSGKTTRVSTGVGEKEGNSSVDIGSISADGQFVAFSSSASNLVSGDANGNWDIFVKDLKTGAITLASTDTNGVQANSYSFWPTLSADGRYVAFMSAATNWTASDANGGYDIFVKDLQSGILTLVSKDLAGAPGDGDSLFPSLSADGQHVAFRSFASNLVPDDNNGFYDVFVSDLQTGAITRLSTDAFGIEGNLHSYEPNLSPDGRYVAFYSQAANLAASDNNTVEDVFITPTGFTAAAANQAPSAADDSATTQEDTPVTILGTTLTANDTDPDGDTLTVTAVGNAQHGAVDLNGGNPIFTPDLNFNGAASFDYTVDDDHGHTATATVTVNVTAVNDAPTAAFTADPNPAAPNQNVSFDGSTSSDADGDALSYSWDFGDGSPNGTGAQVSHVYSAFGTYTVTLTVKDPSNAVGSASHSETVNQGNLPPVANSGGPYVVIAGNGVTLSAAGSSDPNAAAGDSIASYQWDLNNDGVFDHTGASLTLTPTEVQTTFGFGANAIKLQVTDTFGATGSTTTTLTLDRSPTAAFTADPNPAAPNQSVSFDGSTSSDPDSGDSIQSYSWDFGDGSTAFVASSHVSHTYGAFGVYTVTLTVSDAFGATGTVSHSETVNSSPLANAGGPYVVLVGNGVTLSAAGSSDPDAAAGDAIVSYQWDLNNDGTFDRTGASVTLTGTEVQSAFSVGPNSIKLQVTDTLGATGTTTTTLTLDAVPTVSSIVRLDANPTSAASVQYTVTFSEPVTGVDAGDFALTTSALSGAGVSGVTGSGATYTVTVSTGTGEGTLRLDLVDDDSIQDGTSNSLGGSGAGNGSFTSGEIYTVDKALPVVTSITRADADPTNAGTVDYTVTFSEAVTGVDASDFALAITGVSGASITNVSGSGSSYTVTVSTGTGDGTLRLDLGDNDSIQDAVSKPLGGPGVGNGTFKAGEVYTIDRTAPEVSSITRADADPTNSGSVDYTVTFSESVTGVGAGDFALTTTGISGASISGVSGSGSSYTVTVSTGIGDGTVRLDLSDNDSIEDAASNLLGGAGAGNGSFTGGVYTIDKTAPQVSSITRTDADPTNAGSVDYTVTFSESVTGVDAGDFALTTTGISGASISGVSGSGSSYTVTVSTGTGDGTVRLDLSDNDSIQDAASNPLGESGTGNGNFTGEAYTIDRTAPQVSSITRADADPTNTGSVDYTVTFSESVTGVDASDFALSTTGILGANISNVSGADATWTVTVSTGTGDGTLQLNLVDDDSVGDAASNPLAGPGAGNGNFSGDAYTIDKTAPTAIDDDAATRENTTLSVAAAKGVLANDSDAHGLQVITDVVSTDHGGSIDFDADGSFIYTPASHFHGSDTVDYTVSDDAGNTSNATLTIAVTPISVADLNGDGNSDLLWRQNDGQTVLWEMNGTQIAAGSTVAQLGTDWHALNQGDFNGDGNSDIIWRHDSGLTALWEMNGGQLKAATSLGVIGPSWQLQPIGDFDGDGHSDLLWRDEQTGQTAMWLMDGGHLKDGIDLGVVGAGWHVAGVGDFDGDDRSDILWRHDSGQSAIWEMNGGQLKAGIGLGMLGPSWHVAGIGDFNDDAKDDIVWREDSGLTALWQMDGGQIKHVDSLGTIAPSWHVGMVGDFDGSGTADILWRNDNGQTALWEMNGAQTTAAADFGTIGASWHLIGDHLLV